MRIVGRSSSHFTRVLRVFAHELEVDYAFSPVASLLSRTRAEYGDNPALKLPVLEAADGTWFGALSCCRVLARHARRPRRILWPELLTERNAANAQELVLQGMATEVALIMHGLDGTSAYDEKMRESLVQSVGWLEQHLPEALRAQGTEHDLSFLEVSAYCFITHLGFRQVLDTTRYRALDAFCRAYEVRPAIVATAYRFDDV